MPEKFEWPIAKKPSALSVRKIVRKEKSQFLNSVENHTLFRLHRVKIKLTDACNLKCFMCNHWRRPTQRTRIVLSRDRLLSLLDELVSLRTSWVQWSGGEPTLRPDLPDIVGAYRSAGVHSRISTNGTLLSEQYVKSLCHAGLSAALVSLHSADHQVHDRMVGQDGAWDAACRGLSLLKHTGSPEMEICLHPLMTGANIGPGLVALVRVAADIGVTKIDYQAAYCGHLTERDATMTLPTASQVAALQDEYIPSILDEGRRLGIKIDIEGLKKKRFHVDGLRLHHTGEHAKGYWVTHTCYAPWYYSVIGVSGDVFACSHMRSSSGLVGNITHTPLSRVINSPRAIGLRRRLRSADIPRECKMCTMHIDTNEAIDQAVCFQRAE